MRYNSPSFLMLEAGRSKLFLPNEPNLGRRACVEPQNPVPSRGTNVVVDYLELCEVYPDHRLRPYYSLDKAEIETIC